MDTTNDLINNITRVLEIALQEVCLDGCISYITGCQCICVQATSGLVVRGKTAKIDLQASVGDDGYWNQEIEIWSTTPNGIVGLHKCRITEVIDSLMKTKKALLQ